MTTASKQATDPSHARALELVRDSDRFLLVGHVRPDGDCIGSQGALARGLSQLGKDVTIVNPDDPGPMFGYLYENGPYQVFDGESLPPHDVVVLLDFNELSRCGKMAEAIERAGARKLVVDHHPASGPVWWDESFVDVTASATGLLVWRMLTQLGVEIDQVAAAGVFTSLVTDTGWFRYSNTDVETMEVATEILRRGVDPTRVFASVYQRNPPSEPRAIASLLERSEYFCDGRLAVVDHPLDAGDANELVSSDAVLDILRSVGEVEVVLYVRELENGICKLSARSKTDYNVNKLAKRFGGGGHVKASGATIAGSLHDVRQELIEAATEGFARG